APWRPLVSRSLLRPGDPAAAAAACCASGPGTESRTEGRARRRRNGRRAISQQVVRSAQDETARIVLRVGAIHSTARMVRVMAERTSSPFVNVTMWSGGDYSTATKGAKDVIDGATPLVLEAIRRMPNTGTSSPFTLTDMGCAAGGPSIDLVRQAIGAVRARWPQRPITVVYNDQPRNDF